MEAVRELEVPLRHPEAGRTGTLTLRLPVEREEAGPRPPLVDASADPEREEDVPPVQLLESEEYLYELQLRGDHAGPVEPEPSKLFSRDDEDGLRGRLRPGLHTGELPLRFGAAGRILGRGRVEVRSRKLSYREHYRWMLGDLADGMAELIMQRFAPSRQRFQLDETVEAPTLYQRFAFLRSLLESRVFGGAVQHVLTRPYRTWVEEEEERKLGRGVPASSDVARQIAGPGPRTDAGRLEEALGVDTVPRTLRVRRTEETRDNIPNRFVRFALERWRDVVTQIEKLLQVSDSSSAPVERGLRECRTLRDRLDAVLARELFRACGPLRSFPASNQVLHKREGYRDIFRAYVQFDAAAQLSWSGGEDVYGAGQRDVATLYEYWVFHALGREISELCDEPFDLASLIEPSNGGLHLALERGERRILSGEVRRLGRTLDVELWFNRTFSAASGRDESWTRGMRPDCSLRIRPPENDASFFYEEVWLHFDAKYRVDRLEEALGREADDPELEVQVVEEEERRAKRGEEVDTEKEGEGAGRAKRSDLLRMHAYRDAIRRSSGAYVVYPGTEPAAHTEYREILPGLGAFPLRPTDGDRPEGASGVRRFIDEVLDQVALQTTQHERARYWIGTSYGPETGAAENADDGIPEAPGPRVRAAPFLEEPPADAEVLLGYVKSGEHHRWIRREGLYNLRGDDRTGSVDVGSDELGAPWLVLYGRAPGLPEVRPIAGEPRVIHRADMIDRGYPSPGGRLYFCLPVGPRRSYEPVEDLASGKLVAFHRRRCGGPKGMPLVVSWKELVESVVD